MACIVRDFLIIVDGSHKTVPDPSMQPATSRGMDAWWDYGFRSAVRKRQLPVELRRVSRDRIHQIPLHGETPPWLYSRAQHATDYACHPNKPTVSFTCKKYT